MVFPLINLTGTTPNCTDSTKLKPTSLNSSHLNSKQYDVQPSYDLPPPRSPGRMRLDQPTPRRRHRSGRSVQDLGYRVELYQQDGHCRHHRRRSFSSIIKSVKLTEQGGKSIVFLIYILSTSYINSLKRFYNATTIFVMAIIDSLLWAAALGLTAYGIVQIPPTGTRETLTYILIALVAVTLSVPLRLAGSY